MPKYKILLLGDGAVGKTSLVYRYVHAQFQQTYKATLGTDIFAKTVELPSGPVELQIWDLSGQAHFSAIRSKFYQKANGGLLVFDLTNETTLNNCPKWIKEVTTAVGEEISLYLVGNKLDLTDLRSVSDDKIQQYATSAGLEYSLASAKSGDNVELVFTKVAEKIVS
ncbi:MAG: Rab family GTPase [Candidatus Hodarchaeales archaeon]|jgi:Ras-related protein Rab-6A